MSCCGIWRTPRRLVAVVVDDHGKARAPIAVALTDDARWGLLVWLHAKGVSELVVTDELASSDTVVAMAMTLGICPWLAPAQVVEGIRRATGLTDRPAKFSAAMLARWRAISALRPYLRAASPDINERQLALL